MANKAKKKLDETTKVKLIYSGELAFFAIVFLVLGILFLTKVIAVQDWKRLVFTWATLVGGFLLIGDFVWALVSKKRRKKICLLDKIMILPVSLFLIGFDLYALITNLLDVEVYAIVVGVDFIYIAADYIFQSIYHYFKPVPGLFEDEKKPETPAIEEEVVEDKEPTDTDQKGE